MPAPAHILVATDFSPAADNAVQRAAALAASLHARLSVVHVFDNRAWQNARRMFQRDEWVHGEPEDTARARLAEVLEQARATGAAESRFLVHDHSVARGLQQLCDEEAPDLLVLGARGEHWLKDMVLGTTALKVLRASRVPVLVSRLPAAQNYRTAVLAVDFSPASERAAQLALQAFPAVKPQLVHAFEVPMEGRMRLAGAKADELELYLRITRSHAEAELQGFAARVLGQHVKNAAVQAIHGSPASVLVEAAAGAKAELLAIGRHGGSALDERLMGSVTDNVLHYAPCDVLLVP
jgi:nucleotide-binding universal stress UspA family protein